MSRKVLTLSERVEAIKLHDGGKSSRDVAQIMGVGRMQIQQTSLQGEQYKFCAYFVLLLINLISILF
jgi:transposase